MLKIEPENNLNEPNPAPKDNKKLKIVAHIIFIISVIMAAIGFITLPDKIFVQLISETQLPETEKAIFLIGAPLLVGLAGSMCYFSDKIKKWIAAETVITLLEIACIVYNMIKLL